MSLLPLVNHRAAGDAVLYGHGGELDAAVFLAQATRLADALPGCGRVINLCETRHGFMVAFAAALMGGQISLLPSARGSDDRKALRRRHPEACLVSEYPIDGEEGFPIAPYLEDRTPGLLAIPRIDSRVVAATLFTSGSTGEPTAHHKTWGRLCRGASLLAAALGWGSRPDVAIVGSVPSQHMFGLESTVMLPWQSGVPVHYRQPLLAADLEAAFREGERPAWWMTTPVLLRAPLKAATELAGLEGIVASTLSLPATLALAAEEAWRAPVIEVYGSTETGALATRRTASEREWTPLPGVVLRVEGDGETPGVRAEGPHIDPPAILSDVLQLRPGGRFLWLGRTGDMVKIGGKRASLAALNLALAEIPGVVDGVFAYPPETGAAGEPTDPTRRLTAFYASEALAPEQLLAALRARIDPAFLPRPVRRVARVPRDANGKVTQAALADLFALFPPAQCIASSHPALDGHFPGDPRVPGAMLLARVAESLRASFPPFLPGELRDARFHAALGPGEPFVIAAWRGDGHARFEVRRAPGEGESGAVIASGVWALVRAEPESPRP